MIASEAERWLVEMRDKTGQGVPLSSPECERLACGFAACTLVMDLARSLGRLTSGSDHRVAGPTDYTALLAHLMGALETEAGRPVEDAFWDQLVSDSTAAEWEKQFGWRNPWREMHQWLFLGMVSKAAANPADVRAKGFAHRTCCRVLTPGQRDAVEGATGNESLERDWTHRWWPRCLQSLKAVFCDSIWKEGGSLGARALARLLASRLDHSDLVRLVKHKNNYLVYCTGRLNRAIDRPPLPEGWFGRCISQLADARAIGENAWLSREDCRCLAVLVEWLEANGLRERVGTPPRYLEGAQIRGIARTTSEGVTVPAERLDVLWQELVGVDRAVRMRCLPADWGSRRPIQDLFSFSLKSSMRRWRQRAKAYGLA